MSTPGEAKTREGRRRARSYETDTLRFMALRLCNEVEG
jgi:hypothetical protein